MNGNRCIGIAQQRSNESASCKSHSLRRYFFSIYSISFIRVMINLYRNGSLIACSTMHTCPCSVSSSARLVNVSIDCLGYGFSSDMAMLISSFPIFHQALSSGTTLLDLAMVQAEVRSTIFQVPTSVSLIYLDHETRSHRISVQTDGEKCSD